ncbi:MAG TPA: hypothetical protein PKE69_04295 [Pyrinomonadaceae bacterium]|nr:hypothetical protein [Pyrinomonadaceae bacterium]
MNCVCVYELPSALADGANHNTLSALAKFQKLSTILIALAKAVRIVSFFINSAKALHLDLINPSAKADGNSYNFNDALLHLQEYCNDKFHFYIQKEHNYFNLNFQFSQAYFREKFKTV